MQSITAKDKKELIKKCTPKSRILKNTFFAFCVGGGISLCAELLRNLYILLGVSEKDSLPLSTISIVLVGGVLTALGYFDRIARIAGAGTLVPITGFSNSIVSSAIDSTSEGYILGVGKGIFTVAGPVILYATVGGVVYGLVYYIIKSISAFL